MFTDLHQIIKPCKYFLFQVLNKVQIHSVHSYVRVKEMVKEEYIIILLPSPCKMSSTGLFKTRGYAKFGKLQNAYTRTMRIIRALITSNRSRTRLYNRLITTFKTMYIFCLFTYSSCMKKYIYIYIKIF